MPVTRPVAEPIVAINVLLLAHVPPPASLSVTVDPRHTSVGPKITDGNGFTVTTVVMMQPVPMV